MGDGGSPALTDSHLVLQPFSALVTDPPVRLGGTKRRRRGMGCGSDAYLYLCKVLCVCEPRDSPEGHNPRVFWEGGGNARAAHCSALTRGVVDPSAALAKASAGCWVPKQIRLRCFVLGRIAAISQAILHVHFGLLNDPFAFAKL